jgi:hypothetical protein
VTPAITQTRQEQQLSQSFARELRSLITSEGRLQLSIEQVPIGAVADDEVVVRIDDVPLNPSDILNLFGSLDPGPRIIEGDLGMAWGVGGWLVMWFLSTLDATEVGSLRARVARELNTTFASHYTAEISLTDVLSPDVIRAYTRFATGEKYLVVPSV